MNFLSLIFLFLMIFLPSVVSLICVNIGKVLCEIYAKFGFIWVEVYLISYNSWVDLGEGWAVSGGGLMRKARLFGGG